MEGLQRLGEARRATLAPNWCTHPAEARQGAAPPAAPPAPTPALRPAPPAVPVPGRPASGRLALHASHWGSESSRVARLLCFGIATTSSRAELTLATVVIDSLAEFTPALIRSIEPRR